MEFALSRYESSTLIAVDMYTAYVINNKPPHLWHYNVEFIRLLTA